MEIGPEISKGNKGFDPKSLLSLEDEEEYRVESIIGKRVEKVLGLFSFVVHTVVFVANA